MQFCNKKLYLLSANLPIWRWFAWYITKIVAKSFSDKLTPNMKDNRVAKNRRFIRKSLLKFVLCCSVVLVIITIQNILPFVCLVCITGLFDHCGEKKVLFFSNQTSGFYTLSSQQDKRTLALNRKKNLLWKKLSSNQSKTNLICNPMQNAFALLSILNESVAVAKVSIFLRRRCQFIIVSVI